MRIPDRVSATLFISVRAFEFSRPKFPLFQPHPERGGATSLRSVCVSAFSGSILSFNRPDNAVTTTTSKLARTFQRHFASSRMLNSSRDSSRVLRSYGTFHAAENSGQSRTTLRRRRCAILLREERRRRRNTLRAVFADPSLLRYLCIDRNIIRFARITLERRPLSLSLRSGHARVAASGRAVPSFPSAIPRRITVDQSAIARVLPGNRRKCDCAIIAANEVIECSNGSAG